MTDSSQPSPARPQGVQPEGPAAGQQGTALGLCTAALETFPGVVVLVDQAGVVHPFGLGPGWLADARLLAPDGDLVALALEAASHGTAGHHVIQVTTSQGARACDVTLLPVTGASTGTLVLVRDVTLDTSLRNALTESRQRYKDLVEISSDFTWETNADGILVFVSPGGALDYEPSDLVGRRADALLAEMPNDGSPFMATEAIDDAEIVVERADGGRAHLTASAVPLHGVDGEWLGARGVCRDVTVLRQRDEAISRSRNRERLLSYIVRSFRDEVDPAAMLRNAANAIARGMGSEGCAIFRARPGADGRLDVDLFRNAMELGPGLEVEELRDILEQVIRHGRQLELSVGDCAVIVALTRYQQEVNGALCLWREIWREDWDDEDRLLFADISAHVAIAIAQIDRHDRILALSRTDGLTGLANRRAFIEDVSRRLERLHRGSGTSGFVYLDLDNFKLVNDNFGHQRGDEALLAVTQILRETSRPTDLVARLGGDEFAIWLESADEQGARRFCDRLSAASTVLLAFSGDPARPLTVSMGAAVTGGGGPPEQLDALMARADMAMYDAKQQGKARYQILGRLPPAGGTGRR